MKKTIRILTALSLLLSLHFTVKASHMAGGNLTYTYLGNGSYHVQLTLYRDCSGITMNTQQTVTATSSCGTVTVILPLAPNSGNIVSNTPCATFVTCYEEYLYEGTLTLPGNCNDWVLSWNECCRNDAIDNLVSASSQSFYISAFLNNNASPTNSSPTFLYDPIQVFCQGQQYFFDWGIVEQDGDSLVFSFTTPLGNNPSDLLQFTGSQSASCPFPTTPPCSITINPNTGVLNFVPSQIGEFVFAILIQEYNSAGVLIGTVVRDIQINVVGNCNVLIPEPDPIIAYDPTNTNQGIHLSCGDTSLVYLIDTTIVKVQCGSLAADGSDFRLVGPVSNSNLVPITSAVALNCTGGLLSQIQLNLFEPLVNGLYHLYTKVGNDGNTLVGECGFAMPEFDTVLVIVDDTSQLQLASAVLNCNSESVTFDFPEGFDCSTLTSDASDFSLYDQSGNFLLITSITSSDCNAGAEFGYQLTVGFDFGGVIPDSLYLVVKTGTDNNTIANRCGNFSDIGDILGAASINGSIPVDLGIDMNLCDYDPIPLLDPTVTASLYEWTMNLDTAIIASSPTFQPTMAGTYVLYVADGPTCFGRDTVNIFITPSPQIDLGPDVGYCTGDPVQNLDATYPGANSYSWTFNSVFLSNDSIISPALGQTGLYVVEVNVGAQCLGYDSIYVEFVQQLSVTVTGTDTLCTGESANLNVTVQGPNPDTYQWTFNGNPFGGNSSTININEGGTYSVLVTSPSGCTGTQNFSVATAEYPPAPVASCVSFANGLYTYDWTTVTGATEYQVSLDGGITWISPSSGPGGNQHQTSTLSSVLIVRALNDSKCSPGVASLPAACDVEIIIPNIITPANDDDRNDAFFIRNLIQYPDNSIKIFNRWGKLVYEKNSYGLDGYWWTGGDDVAGGVYFYVLNLADGTDPRTGTITVVK